ncbi:periplasmic or secreted lipoprotein [Nitrosococcus oceani ATCC 19707]|uniref:Osmotically-inducible protein Y n=2 Tax=Nitrosococcus oceani TaxID=1229 RepID=Q3JED8_NITOC|nr:BON domain-containing protein [Nitrosococcus oceani]ABA56808.1 periplasmic or secreted lipoprotein [Nitrosococcus oceani ATCC 19707]EDZ65759.1 Putative phospholipid-binding domain family [Nitrosococcus oceani AFC27]KFI20762.1 transporter [Nitrosococcus oceani C-27]
MKNPIKYIGFMLIVFMAVLMLGCADSPKQSAGGYVDDAWITSKVKSSLLSDPLVSGTDVEVNTYQGVVQLSGFVATEEQSEEAERITRSIKGVKDVENKITVK